MDGMAAFRYASGNFLIPSEKGVLKKKKKLNAGPKTRSKNMPRAGRKEVFTIIERFELIINSFIIKQ